MANRDALITMSTLSGWVQREKELELRDELVALR
jgi:hypothetical protein